MNFEALEKLFKNSITFNKKKLLITFLALSFCGFLVSLIRSITVHVGTWGQITLSILPGILTFTTLFFLGIYLNLLKNFEKNDVEISYLNLFFKSSKVVGPVLSLALPLLVLFLAFSCILGMFFLLKHLPVIGQMLSAILTLGPFIMFFGSLCLAMLSIVMYFFLTPIISKENNITLNSLTQAYEQFKKSPALNLLLFFLASVPLTFILVMLGCSLLFTQMAYGKEIATAFVGLKWFFLMLPFNAILSPFLIFFFNFSCESNRYMARLSKQKLES